MRSRTPSPAVGLVIALGSAAGCGGEEMFLPELGTNEHLIETAAATRLASPDQGLEQPLVVSDLDGDGIDDAIVRSNFTFPGPDGKTVLYGGSSVTGSLDLASLPVRIRGPPSASVALGTGVVAVGDVDAMVSLVRLWLGPAGDIAVGLEVTPRLSLQACVELGLVATGATARDTGEPVAALAGAWTSLGLAAALEL